MQREFDASYVLQDSLHGVLLMFLPQDMRRLYFLPDWAVVEEHLQTQHYGISRLLVLTKTVVVRLLGDQLHEDPKLDNPLQQTGHP